MALDLIEELEAVLQGFENAGIELALCGGLALAVHGHPRATMDIDLLIRSEQVSEAIRVARQLGFDVPARKMTFGLQTHAPREVQRVSKLDPATNDLLSLDLLVVSAELEEVWSTRIVAPWGGRELCVVSRAGLVTMKRIAGRPQDLADIAALEQANGNDST